ncbi:MAG: hypothetical protein ABI273_20095, partial [Lacunisphaera sp.]
MADTGAGVAGNAGADLMTDGVDENEGRAGGNGGGAIGDLAASGGGNGADLATGIGGVDIGEFVTGREIGGGIAGDRTAIAGGGGGTLTAGAVENFGAIGAGTAGGFNAARAAAAALITSSFSRTTSSADLTKTPGGNFSLGCSTSGS